MNPRRRRHARKRRMMAKMRAEAVLYLRSKVSEWASITSLLPPTIVETSYDAERGVITADLPMPDGIRVHVQQGP
jgi:hypothetical protein